MDAFRRQIFYVFIVALKTRKRVTHKGVTEGKGFTNPILYFLGKTSTTSSIAAELFGNDQEVSIYRTFNQIRI
jgi:hypothetical protein